MNTANWKWKASKIITGKKRKGRLFSEQLRVLCGEKTREFIAMFWGSLVPENKGLITKMPNKKVKFASFLWLWDYLHLRFNMPNACYVASECDNRLLKCSLNWDEGRLSEVISFLAWEVLHTVSTNTTIY